MIGPGVAVPAPVEVELLQSVRVIQASIRQFPVCAQCIDLGYGNRDNVCEHGVGTHQRHA